MHAWLNQCYGANTIHVTSLRPEPQNSEGNQQNTDINTVTDILVVKEVWYYEKERPHSCTYALKSFTMTGL
jgi:hypothetical protein